MKSIGIDVSKEVLDVSLYDGKDYKDYQYENTKAGIKLLIKKLNREKSDIKITMESTGTYYLRCAELLYETEKLVYVVNPLIIKRYAQMRLHRTKTDKVDARLIAEYGYREESREYKPEDKARREIRLRLRLIEQLQNDITRNRNRIEGLKQYPSGTEKIIKIHERTNKYLDKHIKKIKEEIREFIESDKKYKELKEKIEKIEGVGEVISSVIISYFGKFEYFENAKQVASFIGIIPRINQSGSSVRGKGSMSRVGNNYIRKQLTMGARTAMMYNPSCKALNERLIEKNKSYKERMVAVAHKLLRQIFGVIKNNEEYNPYYVKNSVVCS